MDYWTQLSIDYANQRNYLDDLFSVYPTIPDGIRDIDDKLWNRIEIAYKRKNDIELLQELFKMDLFPIKDSYIAFLRKDLSALKRNPKTVKRICGRIYEMGLDRIYDKCSEPKETNRQIGPMFRRWVNKKVLGIEPISIEKFTRTKQDAILDASDEILKQFAKNNLNYHRDKGLDFLARFNNQYVIGEAKFLTDEGGSQNSDFEDAIATLDEKNIKAIRVAILDGVLYLKSKKKMHRFITDPYKNYHIMSALVLREFLYQI